MTVFVAAKVIVTHPTSSQFLLVKREKNGIFSYEPAGGRVEVDLVKKYAENLEECARREVKEELGIEIDRMEYIGSYSFFWTKRENTCSVCAVFLAEMVWGAEINTVADSSCSPAYPEWVASEDILHGKIPIDPSSRGLLELMKTVAVRFQKHGAPKEIK